MKCKEQNHTQKVVGFSNTAWKCRNKDNSLFDTVNCLSRISLHQNCPRYLCCADLGYIDMFKLHKHSYKYQMLIPMYKEVAKKLNYFLKMLWGVMNYVVDKG